MKKLALLFLLLISLTGFSQSSNRIITGTVYDATDKNPLVGVAVTIDGTKQGTTTNVQGQFTLTVPQGKEMLTFSYIGYAAKKVRLSTVDRVTVYLKPSQQALLEVTAMGYSADANAEVRIDEPVGRSDSKAIVEPSASRVTSAQVTKTSRRKQQATAMMIFPAPPSNVATPADESYKGVTENGFQNPLDNPLSTFSVDVDAASYTNVRRFINGGQLPPKDAVRIEEMINYFNYDLPAPTGNSPVAIHTELSAAPWNAQHRLLRIGLKAKAVDSAKLPASNMVFLIDVSGSMWEPNKLPLVQSSLKLLVDQLRAKDKVAIVVYAGAAGLVLPPTSGDQKTTIKDAIDRLTAGGSTAGGAGIKLAYKTAIENYIKGGNNRVILATDGDFNVGALSDADMEQLIENERKSGVFLSALGFGMGNYKDSKMETLADKGNGNYAYIDNITEARKTLVSEFGGTLFTVAKDVKLQLEFNPGKVQAYRLIGYENRMLNKEDFNNDLKDAGDMGVGHTVTALYEIIPVGVKDNFTNSVDPLKYQKVQKTPSVYTSEDMVTIKFRYKEPESDKSKLSQVVVMDKPIASANTSVDFRFAAAVAEFGMLLRGSDYKQNSTFEQAIEMARAAKGTDHEGYRAEFVKLAESAKLMAQSGLAAKE
ncbi:vWA domain-containing protein [Mucilaginibacter jinjuensis]|uniref:von Willebrand factor type A domain-containing protein n=1 Tax=Mucilaginibacter jinjuensis TaxID=1176721 RepID=A0ABY7T6B5_9SPHI|nr:von Willebrand factor type A domain-containing protein [Mucilaginibacter jinjuensis]WCT12020.1 von Willebrand factor type A domain-containing protein [Mucilaginibacter jinjuensis]